VQVRRSPAFGHTLRTNYGRDLNVFLATCPSDGVLFKLANHRDGGQRLGWRFRANPEFPRRHRRLPGVILQLMTCGTRSLSPSH